MPPVNISYAVTTNMLLVAGNPTTFIGDDTITGSSAADTLSGYGGNDSIVGGGGGDLILGDGTTSAANGSTLGSGSGNDTLDGGAGNDTMYGGAGNDVYYVDSTSDLISEASTIGGSTDATGTDTVYSTVSWTLGNYFENLTLIGVGNINGTGNALNNVLIGNSGANTLNGAAGNDTMQGGAGNDVYSVDSAADVVSETTVLNGNVDAGGTDTVNSAVNWSLGLYVENLTLTGTGTINGAGNELANAINGNSGANSLSGGAGNDTIDAAGGNDTLDGGTGDDGMYGRAGNDVYYIDSAADVVSEAVSAVNSADAGGADTVISSVSWTLGSYFENLTLAGSAALSGTGNTLNNFLTGNGGSNTLDGGAGNDTMYGGAGNDFYVVDSTSDMASEAVSSGNPADAGGNDTVSASVAYTLGNYLENLTLTGSGNIAGTGNALNNVLVGNLGANTLNGAAGIDTMYGGAGNDSYTVDNMSDVVSEAVSSINAADAGGIDTVSASVAYTLGNYLENLTLTGSAGIAGTGNALDNRLTGNTGNNLLSAAAGNDTLDGGAGNDTMYGGAGNDAYVVDSTSDVVSEAVSSGNPADAGGNDTVSASVAYTLGNYLENLTLTGSAGIAGTGNALDNVLIGNSGANALNGLAGNDTMYGGAGNDSYTVDSLGDVISENVSSTDASDAGGIDTVVSSVSWTLGDRFENLTLSGSAALTGTGNAADNAITGNAGANLLWGGAGNDTINGGAGLDTMYGGSGNDVYTVDNENDAVIERLSATSALDAGGDDLVLSSVDYKLGYFVERLTLTGTAYSGTGNSLNNTIIGNAGSNRLDGSTGVDTLYGGAGNDVYVVDNPGDVVSEAVSSANPADAGGTDQVISWAASYTLSSYVENLYLAGGANLSGSGNDLNNVLFGNIGANRLNGGGGNDVLNGFLGNDTLIGSFGNDTLTGGDGLDSFQFSALVSSASLNGVDTITDFSVTQDLIRIDRSGVTGIGGSAAGTLAASAFVSGAGLDHALNGSQRFIYDTSSGALYYDADGSGSASAAVKFAVLGTTAHPALTSANIQLF